MLRSCGPSFFIIYFHTLRIFDFGLPRNVPSRFAKQQVLIQGDIQTLWQDQFVDVETEKLDVQIYPALPLLL